MQYIYLSGLSLSFTPSVGFCNNPLQTTESRSLLPTPYSLKSRTWNYP
ncbi:MAG: hypothetical protein F6J90_10980 [Moorea sp. SIOASIH]|nr:hypothetical protein [Moorena sp. SIOASIH]NEO36803.1 hypothetical protein [Moorena sp. SIOASIH]